MKISFHVMAACLGFTLMGASAPMEGEETFSSSRLQRAFQELQDVLASPPSDAVIQRQLEEYSQNGFDDSFLENFQHNPGLREKVFGCQQRLQKAFSELEEAMPRSPAGLQQDRDSLGLQKAGDGFLEDPALGTRAWLQQSLAPTDAPWDLWEDHTLNMPVSTALLQEEWDSLLPSSPVSLQDKKEPGFWDILGQEEENPLWAPVQQLATSLEVEEEIMTGRVMDQGSKQPQSSRNKNTKPYARVGVRQEKHKQASQRARDITAENIALLREWAESDEALAARIDHIDTNQTLEQQEVVKKIEVFNRDYNAGLIADVRPRNALYAKLSRLKTNLLRALYTTEIKSVARGAQGPGEE